MSRIAFVPRIRFSRAFYLGWSRPPSPCLGFFRSFFFIFLSFWTTTMAVVGGRPCTRLATSNAWAYPLKMKSSPSRNLILTVISCTRARAVYESIQRFHRRVGFRTGVVRWYNFEEDGTRVYREREGRERENELRETFEENTVTNEPEDKRANEHGVSRN